MADTLEPTPQFSEAKARVPWVREVPGEAPPIPWATPRSLMAGSDMNSRSRRAQPSALTRFDWPLAWNRLARST
jgi:hypothetical protein